MKQIPVSLLTLVAGVIITLISIWVGQHHGLLPEQASEQAPLVDSLFDTMMIIATALFLVVEGAIVTFLIMFRKREGDETDGLPIEGNLPLEAFWTAIPAIIVIGLGIYSVAIFQEMGGLNPGDHAVMAHTPKSTLVAQMPEGDLPIAGDVMPLMADADGIESEEVRPYYGFGSPDQDHVKQADLVINVTGIQFAWLFNYPNDNITTGELHVPVGKDVQLNLSAQDVIHSLWVPQFRLKQDARSQNGVTVCGNEARHVSGGLYGALRSLSWRDAIAGHCPHPRGI
jgi:cytochrome c oxidase subunit II